MSSNPPVNPTNQPPLPVEQVPPDITIPIYAPSSKTKNPLSFLFNLLFFLFGIGGIGFGLFMQSQITTLKQASQNISTKITTTPSPISSTIMPSKIMQQISPTLASSSAVSTDETIEKETLCFTLTLPKKNDVGAENNCDILYRSFPDENNPDSSVTVSVTLNDKEFIDSQNMADQWLQMEKDRGSDETLVEKGPIQVGGVEGYKVVTEYANKSVQTTHIFIYNPGKYEAYGYPITGFELLSASDLNTRSIQQIELERLLATWQWK
ncbi:hypothetical protein COY87_05535 [Candidatus Roizmanbacteria bacterium CG_4_10_14_0_8_um_filter_33_9]|uniref:Uncharacterized protein n=1 Tax=Candidatus Roizmanbacteria bacterium CG_4_10_14_0_8_um_filter_33_9 TaxID=1974826 RepID=A0A2M7QGU7_9BACT|nr:MAG: hypothetical protein COY87_05535 [Candidatus Roizmanbacteria bacterium CG_4_10_14_0_8_um_filter_33_9]